MMAKRLGVSRSNPRRKQQARKLRSCLRAALRTRGAKAELSRIYAEAIEKGLARGPNLSPDRISRMLSDKEGLHSEPWILWRLSEGAFYSRAPVPHALVLYALGGRLEALVHTIGTVNFSKIGGAGVLRDMLPWLGREDDLEATQRLWTLHSKQREAFLPPNKAAEQFVRNLRGLDDYSGHLELALILANSPDIPYEHCRGLVIEQLMKWLTSVQEKGETFTLR